MLWRDGVRRSSGTLYRIVDGSLWVGSGDGSMAMEARSSNPLSGDSNQLGSAR